MAVQYQPLVVVVVVDFILQDQMITIYLYVWACMPLHQKDNIFRELLSFSPKYFNIKHSFGFRA